MISTIHMKQRSVQDMITDYVHMAQVGVVITVLRTLSLVFLLANIQIAYASQAPQLQREDLFESFSDLDEPELHWQLGDLDRELWDEDEKLIFEKREKRKKKQKAVKLYLKEEHRKKVLLGANKRVSSAPAVDGRVGTARDFSASSGELRGKQISKKNYTQNNSTDNTLGLVAYDMAVVGVQISAALCCANTLYNYAEKGYDKCCAYIARLRNKKNKDKANAKQKDGANKSKANSKLIVHSLCNQKPL